MIRVTNLSKKYHIKDAEDVLALDNISFTLPDTGMIFIVGKSGSGKTTLLNILGSLDKPTSGSIEADSFKLENMGEEEASIYRDNYAGFIFQDYSLIDSLDVERNIKIALDIRGEDSSNLVNAALEKVGLNDFNKRKIKSLSAGQKQRVAIARGYIKKPRLLLCDEPTGNLDSKTSAQILDLLHELSKETLVVVVSHNINDAYLYGDRIIEILDGKIINDLSSTAKNKKYEIKDGNLYVSDVSSLDENEIEDINKKLNSSEIKTIHPHKELFVENEQNNGVLRDFHFKRNNISTKNKIKLSTNFLGRRIISTSIISIVSAVIMILFGLCQFFTSFSLNKVMKNTLSSNDQKTFVIKKATYKDNKKKDIDTSTIISITDDDKKAIKDSGYSSEIYTLYNYSLPVSLHYWQLSSEVSISDSSNLKDLYLQEIYGVLPIKENGFNKIFGNYTYVGNLTAKDYGIIITDYIADSILYYRGDTFTSYEDILGTYKNRDNSIYAYINAIVNTGYKERYSSLINSFNDPKVDYEDLLVGNDYLYFYEEVRNYLGTAYSLNESFFTSSNNIEARNLARLDNTRFEVPFLGESSYLYNGWAFIDSEYGYDLEDNTLGISVSAFNSLLSSNYSYDELAVYDGYEINLTKYRKYHPQDESVYNKTVKIKILDTNYFSYIASDDLFSYLRNYDIIPYSIHLLDLGKAGAAYEAVKGTPFVPCSSFIEAGIYINNVASIFKDLFGLISSVLLFGLILVLGFHTFLNITLRQYDIGVLKSLGMSNKDITEVFVIQIIISTIVTSIIYGIGLVVFTKITNRILFNSFMSSIKNPALRFISILSFNPWILLIDILIIIVVNLLITIIPFIMLMHKKPLNILRK